MVTELAAKVLGAHCKARGYLPSCSPETGAISAMLKWSLGLLFALAALLLSPTAFAGSLSFTLSLTGAQLSVIHQGDVSAFYPAAFRMLPDGAWQQLKPTGAQNELTPGARVHFVWPDARPLEQLSAFERLQPVMVRFFDQAGVGFGQISFFRAPPAATISLNARYAGGALRIEPPDGVPSIRASWLLWAQEDGIRPIRSPVRFEHRQPPAMRIDWQRQSGAPFQLDTGAGQPSALLIHETAQGYALQSVPGGGLQGKEQRAAWLAATPKFYMASLIALGIAVAAMALQWLRRIRHRAKS